MEVKVGQVWRWKDSGSNTKVGFVQNDTVYMDFSDGYRSPYSIRELLEECELVTLDNIKPGEWVECIKTKEIGKGLKYITGTKYKVGISDRTAAINGENPDSWHYLRSSFDDIFKPCPPPIEEYVAEPKTYTNSQIMDMIEQGYFVEGDKIYTGNTIPPLVFSTDEYGYSSFVMYQDHMKNGCFAKGDLWELDLVDRWEEVTIDEAVDEIAHGGVVKVVLKTGEYGIVESESDWNSAIVFSDVCYGTWYKKVNHNDD